VFWVSCRAEKALWIELKENGERTTTIAMTEGIARQLLDAKEINVSFSEKGKSELITREMLQAVLDGRERSLTARDGHGSEATVSLRSLSIPGGRNGSNRLVLETYKSGKQTFRIALPELEIEQADDKGDEFVKINFGWKALLPFLAKVGGAVYINDQKDGTEVWIYVE
jgi:hypothetical protein